MDKVNEFLDRPVMNGVEINRPTARGAPANPTHSIRADARPGPSAPSGALVGTARITLRAIDAHVISTRAGRDDRRRHRKNNAHGRARRRRESRPRRAGERLAEGG